MKKYIKIHSGLLGVGIGFLNFYILFYSWNISWEISFAVAFASGFIASKFLDVYAGKMSEEDLDKEKAEEISNAINDFEKKWFNFKSIKMGKHHQNLLNNLEELRKSAGLTQQDLSESAEVSRKSINAIENGIYVPSTVLALKIAKTLKCNVEDIFKLP